MKAFYIIGMLAVIALFAGCQQLENTINVVGSYEMTYRPDQAEVFMGVSLVKPTANEAQNEANRVNSGIISGLKSSGIEDNNIQSEQVSLSEERTYTEKEGSKVIGWRATQLLKVKTMDISKVGMIVDIATINGANQINSIDFSLSPAKEQEYRTVALGAASNNARSKAQAVASSLGVRLGNIKSVTETSFNFIPYTYSMKLGSSDQAVAEAASIMPSDVKITATVSMVYYVR